MSSTDRVGDGSTNAPPVIRMYARDERLTRDRCADRNSTDAVTLIRPRAEITSGFPDPTANMRQGLCIIQLLLANGGRARSGGTVYTDKSPSVRNWCRQRCGVTVARDHRMIASRL